MSDGPATTPNETVDGSGNNAIDDEPTRHAARWGSVERSAEERSIKRRAHRKSRYGCKNCKTRRIKCDERKPECTNCRNRQVRCDYLPTALSQTASRTLSCESTASPSDAAPAPNALNVADAELMYYWTTSTCHTLSAQSAGATFWRTSVTEVGLAHAYVLHLLLAITALHLAHCRPTRRDEYVAHADKHYTAALPSVTSELSHINQGNCDAVLLSVQIICFITWARGPKPGEFLAFGVNGRSEWLIMFRGVRTTRESLDQGSFTRSLAPNLRAKTAPLRELKPPPDYKEPLVELLSYIKSNSVPSQLESNLCSHEVLLECYQNRHNGIDGEYHVVFAWLYKMQEGFLEALQRHDAVPLVLYAHFAVLMNDMETFWYMRGWTAHVLGGIWGILRDEDRVWIRWPMAVVGFIPP
ncbi:hypothetical protein K458DRAFT_380032 [Lentithecium fluviatile CBS 122367]|uniref:Zn(2)-C6 fungal-type domain-containing protein n=1 Tax=Lentithecium fluviatile CBS 122367 TaxID=1168545 RepID=A0A6G1IDH6_9PLEO|nr:hypothetical protein K458DRAFT_380032 [Lentithecium fluviatile CBS 122367]